MEFSLVKDYKVIQRLHLLRWQGKFGGGRFWEVYISVGLLYRSPLGILPGWYEVMAALYQLHSTFHIRYIFNSSQNSVLDPIQGPVCPLAASRWRIGTPKPVRMKRPPKLQNLGTVHDILCVLYDLLQVAVNWCGGKVCTPPYSVILFQSAFKFAD
jgi:hypothetical protein